MRNQNQFGGCCDERYGKHDEAGPEASIKDVEASG
jgi:hypothetical protein